MTFAELPIKSRFVFASSPSLTAIKIKTGFARWKWDGHEGFVPVANGCRGEREVIEIPDGKDQRP